MGWKMRVGSLYGWAPALRSLRLLLLPVPQPQHPAALSQVFDSF